jgi:glycosyltransferase involved in cell wall biosynthesis
MKFTVLTATYNRAHTLPDVYQSLCAQTFRDFEWVIIDDGSADGTRELVLSWKPSFPIRYTWKQNGGKHTAVNIGVAQAGYAPGGLGRQGDLRYSNPKGAALYYKELACYRVPVKLRFKAALNAARFSLVAIARELRRFK